MREIVPGVLHWTARHPIGIEVSSYFLAGPRVLIDPMLPPGGVDWFREHGEPVAILLSNRHHYRQSNDLVEAFGCSVHCHEAGLHEFTAGEPVQGFAFGDELPGGVVAHEVDAICPEESALHLPAASALSIADGLIRNGDGPLGFVPDNLMDDPPRTKAGLLAAYRRLLDLDFDHLLLAHGMPLVGDGRARLQGFLDDQDAA